MAPISIPARADLVCTQRGPLPHFLFDCFRFLFEYLWPHNHDAFLSDIVAKWPIKMRDLVRF